jgi:hypothetical protein
VSPLDIKSSQGQEVKIMQDSNLLTAVTDNITTDLKKLTSYTVYHSRQISVWAFLYYKKKSTEPFQHSRMEMHDVIT